MEQRVKPITINPIFQPPQKKRLFGNIVGKIEDAGNQHFILFPQCFQPIPKRIADFSLHLFVFCKSFEFGSLKFCCLVKSKALYQTIESEPFPN